MGNVKIIKPEILSIQRIPNIDSSLAASFSLNEQQNSLGVITANFDHSLYVSIDEGTKESPVDVIYTKSMYGENQSSNSLTGKSIIMFGAKNPDIIDSAIKATIHYMQEKAHYYCINNSIIYFSHVIGSIGPFLASKMNLKEGEAIAYLIAPPIESIIAFDYALKNSNTRLVEFFKPPLVNNYGGGYLTGSISDCQAATKAFQEKIIEISENPIDFLI